MKNNFWVVVVALFSVCMACTKQDNSPTPTPPTPDNPVNEKKDRIVLFNKSTSVSFYLSGRNVTINYGNGNVHPYPSLDSSVPVKFGYFSSTHDSVVITGTGMTYLKCSQTDIRMLNTAGNPALTYLDCSGNPLDSLNLQANTALKFLNCRANNLSKQALDKLFTSLHSTAKPKDSVLFAGNPGTATATVSIATGKGWSTDKVIIEKPSTITFSANHADPLDTDLVLEGTGIIIDWGDGSYNTYATLSRNTPLRHRYSRPVKHWVKVGGDVITYLDCSYTGISDLVVSGAPALTYLDCSTSDIYTLDVTKNTALQHLDCHEAHLSGSLDISKNTALTYLDCHTAGGGSHNHLYKIDASNNPHLKHLNCNTSDVTILELSKNAELTYLNCENNVRMSALNVAGNPALEILSCKNTGLLSLDVSGNPKLKRLDCSWAKLSTLKTANNPALTYLDCEYNMLTSLDASGCTALQQLNCYHNSIATLNVSKNAQLTILSCGDNKLTSLDLSNTTSLTKLYCTQNEFSATALNNLFTSLPTFTLPPPQSGVVAYRLNPGSDACDISIAKNKGWTTFQ